MTYSPDWILAALQVDTFSRKQTEVRICGSKHTEDRNLGLERGGHVGAVVLPPTPRFRTGAGGSRAPAS